VPCAPLSMFYSLGGIAVPLGTPSVENGTHDTEKLLLKTYISEDFA
jgi:hypothetical protein